MPNPPLTLIDFGPVRAVGMSMPALPGKSDFAALWQKQLGPRMPEIAHPPGCLLFGVCRCLPGVTDAPPGTFEYLALMESLPDAPIPPGMLALAIPRCTYAVFEVPDFSQFHAVWQHARQAVAAQSQWHPYCTPTACHCATHPAFELYPPDSHKTGRAQVLIPVHQMNE